MRELRKMVVSVSPVIWGSLGAGTMVMGIFIGWFAFPFILRKAVVNQINLGPEKESRRMWMQLPTFDFNVYIFNVTNTVEVLQGGKAVLNEIGPYCYKEVKDKVDVLEDAAADTITYSARNTWTARQGSDNCAAQHLTGDEIIMTPNVPLLATLMIAQKDFPTPSLILVNLALPKIFGRFSGVFLRTTASSLLSGGILIDCSAADFLARPICNTIKDNSNALKALGANKYSFSFFGAKNGTPERFRYTVRRGTRHSEDVGRLVAIDGKPDMPFWRGDCNKIQGTDSTVFPPFRTKEYGSLTAYSSEVCRIIYGEYEGTYNYKTVAGYAYSATFGDTDLNPSDRCFCPADDRCYKKGTLDAFKCQGAPLVSSLPHFHQGSLDYVNGVRGLNPNKDKHGIFIVLEPTSGVPLVVRKRLQINIDLRPFPFVPSTQGLKHSLVPLFWVEELLELDDDMMGQLDRSLFRPARMAQAACWSCVTGGVALLLMAAVLQLRRHRQNRVQDCGDEAGRDDSYALEWNKYRVDSGTARAQDVSSGHVISDLSAAELMKNVSELPLGFLKRSTSQSNR